VTDASSRRPFPPTFALSVSRTLYPDLTGTVAFHSGWPILAGARLRTHRPILRSELANWVSSSFEVGIDNKRWNAAFEIKGATGQGLLAVHRTFKITEITSVQIGTSVDPLLFPAALSLTVEATQNWRDLVSGGLSVGLSVGFSLGGILLRVRCVNPAIPALLRAAPLPDSPRPRMSVVRETPDNTPWPDDGFVPEQRLVLSCIVKIHARHLTHCFVIRRLVRGGETLLVPIKLTDELRLDLMFFATLVPTLALVGSEVLLLRSAHNRM
jgi:hypothetical protein